MIKIKGGPCAKDLKVYNISDDGTETEITGIMSISFNKIIQGSFVVATIELLEIDLDIETECK